MQSYEGIYENGVVRPLTPLDLPESTPVRIVVPTTVLSDASPVNSSSDGVNRIYEILDRRYHTGIRDLAERHNEHQP